MSSSSWTKSPTTLRNFSLLIMAYMLLAFAWWAVLLYQRNQALYAAQVELLKKSVLTDPSLSAEKAFFESEAFVSLTDKFKRQKWMIFGEAIVFSITLISGLWLINRAHFREVEAARQQRNFLLSITHELKSPIASIRLVLETLGKHTLDSDQLKKLSSGALSEAHRLNDLVSDLLLSAKLESAYQPDFEEIDLNVFLENLTRNFSNHHPGVVLHFEPSTSSCTIRADRQGLHTVLLNLLENGLKYNFEKEKQLWITFTSQKNEVWLNIADNGIGIEEKEKKKVFRKFYRVGNEDTRKTKGTGLGLYIVHEIIRAHGGSISIADNRPRGTVFRLRLPKNPSF